MGAELIKTIALPKVEDDGFLCFVQTPDHIPFNIQRVYYIYGASPDKDRGHHAHKATRQFFICEQGNIELVMDNGQRRESKILEPDTGVMIEPLMWHEMHGFKPDTRLLVLASHRFDESDYIRNYQEFLDYINRG